MTLSNSQIQAFKACRRAYKLKYVDGLERVSTSNALKLGQNYHELVRQYLQGEIEPSATFDDEIVQQAMLYAFATYVRPQLPEQIKPEQWFKFETNGGNNIIGRFDGLAQDGVVIEHKTTSGVIDGNYWAALEQDEQILTYMLASGKNRLVYTVVRKPSIIWNWKKESSSEYYNRCCKWYAVDTDKKAVVMEIYRTQKQIEQFEYDIDLMADEIAHCENYYRNPSNCSSFKICPYQEICYRDNDLDTILFDDAK